ncbi:PPE family protein [Mycobacterium riyadhense]|uniref:PPE family protein n=1 Tax=Mycobacterium riyadhense TaxID=486698 RepID=UPI0023BA43CE|nr:PPE family protein [Mycobacterium riyadhense]
MLDFAALPPEINSALMYAGPGSGPMLTAATAWEVLSAELQTVASSYDALVTGLTDGPWQGPSAAAMASAAAPQVAWLVDTAALAELAGSQAVAAASAYEAAFLATVPPAEVAANRALLMALLATNFLGQNTAAIAATEAQYAEMWAQDAAAMYGYAGASAQASTLTPFSPAAATVNPGGLAAQAASVAQAIGNSTAADAGLQQLTSLLPTVLGDLANPSALLADPLKVLGITGHTYTADGTGVIVGGMLGDLTTAVTGDATLDATTALDTFGRWVSPARLMVTQFKDYVGLAHDLPKFASEGAKAAGEAAKALPALPSVLPNAGGLGGIAAAAGNAAKVGAFSAPASWAGSVPAATPINVALNGLASGAAAEPAASAFGGVPVVPGSGVGRGLAAHFAAPRYGFKPTIMPQPPAGG